MPGKRVAVLSPDGTFGTIDEAHVDALTKAGGRVLTKQQLADRAVQDEYAKASTAKKIGGVASSTLAGPIVSNALAGTGAVAVQPEVEAFQQGMADPMTLGLDRVGVKEAIALTGGKEAARAYAEHEKQIAEASPTAHTLGEVAGYAAQALSGSAGGAARAVPGIGIGALGGAAEAGVGRALAGVAARGVAGRAAVTAAELGARGAVEGALYGAGQQFSEQMLDDHELAADKIFTAAGLGALYGGVGGAALGGTGSLVASGGRAAGGRLSRALRRGAASTEEAATTTPKPVEVPAIDPDAGLLGDFATKDALDLATGPERRPFQIRPDASVRGAVPAEAAPLDFSKRFTIDPDAGLRPPRAGEKGPIRIGEPTKPAPKAMDSAGLYDLVEQVNKQGRFSGLVPIDELQRASGMGMDDFVKLLNKAENDLAIDLKTANDHAVHKGTLIPREQGARGTVHYGYVVARDRPGGAAAAAAAEAPGRVDLLDDVFSRPKRSATGAAPVRSSFDVGIGESGAEAGIARRGAGGRYQGTVEATDALKPSSAKQVPREVVLSPTDDLSRVAAEASPIKLPTVEQPKLGPLASAMRSPADPARRIAFDRAWRAAGGRKAFAAEAERFLPNGTADVGEAFLRHKVIDAEAGALQAGLHGTPEAIAERVQAPLAKVGGRLGEIAETSGAIIDAELITKAVEDVVRPLAKKAGHEGYENSVRAYGESLLDKLGVSDTNRAVKVQDLLFQRQALDDLVYKEAKALDPGGRVEYMRELRGKLEGVITDALDAASGRVAGELRAEYTALKHDYQALRIGQKAAEDAAVRGAANRTFSLTDKIIGSAAGGTGAAIGGPLGGLIAGPGAAAASKFVRERGDAALAALLYRAADTGAIARMTSLVDQQITRAARGFLQGPRKGLLSAAPTKTGATRAEAEAALRRVSEFQADPEAFVNRVTRDTEAMAGVAPNVASAVSARMVNAMAFLSSKMPSLPEPDPLDPHGPPPMTAAQASQVANYARYVDRPMLFLEELERGKATFEGAEVFQALMGNRPIGPSGKTVWQQLQEETLDALATQMARGQRPPYQLRVQLGLLLDAPATPAQRPEHMQYLQNAVNYAAKPPTAPAPPKRSSSVKMPTQRSALDRLEMTGPGR